jgi:hypothetical protein
MSSEQRAAHRLRRAVVVTVAGLVTLVAGAGAANGQTTSTNPGSGLQFASGAVTSVHGSSVQVSNATTQSESTVVLQDSTTYTKRESADASAIVVGSCVRAAGTGSDTKGIAASNVAVSAADANGCTGGFPGAGGRAPGARGANGPRPNFGNRARRPFGGGTGNRPANLAMAFGPVLSVTGDRVTVKSTAFARPTSTSKTSTSKAKTSKATRKTTAKRTTTDVVVSLSASTTISQTVGATAADVVVGKCVTATGAVGSGAVDAARVAISDPVNGACTGGFGGRFGGGGGGTGATA